MKNSTFFLIALFCSLSTFSQISKTDLIQNQKNLKSVESENQSIIQADSIITYQFTSPTDSSIYKKQFTTFNETTNTSNYESWTWNDFTQTWSKYLGTSQQIENATIITYNNWNPDSGAYIPTGKQEYIEEEQYFASYYFYYIPATQTFMGQSKNESWFNTEENDSLNIEYSFNAGLNQWDNTSKTEYLYDSLQNQIEEKGFNWENNSWEIKMRIEDGYDTLGNWTYRNIYTPIFGNLLNTTRYLFTYDSLNNRVNDRLLLFNNNQWTNERNYSLQFDEMNRNILILQEKWDRTENVWNNVRKTLMEYEDLEKSAKQISAISTKTSFLNWNTTSQEWIPESESTSVLNEIGLTEEWWGKIWEINSETWMNFYKYSYKWNIEHSLLLVQVNSNKNTETEDWNPNSKTYYYYNGINVFQSVSNKLMNTITVYPNPARDFVNVMQQTPQKLHLKVYNLTGQLLVQSELNSTINPVNISSFKNGTYVFIVSDGKTSQSFKILKF